MNTDSKEKTKRKIGLKFTILTIMLVLALVAVNVFFTFKKVEYNGQHFKGSITYGIPEVKRLKILLLDKAVIKIESDAGLGLIGSEPIAQITGNKFQEDILYVSEKVIQPGEALKFKYYASTEYNSREAAITIDSEKPFVLTIFHPGWYQIILFCLFLLCAYAIWWLVYQIPNFDWVKDSYLEEY
jgi:hypothetical protein